MKIIVTCVDKARNYMFPKNESKEGEHVYPIINIIKKAISEGEHVKVINLGYPSTADYETIKREMVEEKIAAGYVNVTLDGSLPSQMKGIYDFINNEMTKDYGDSDGNDHEHDELYIDISYTFNRYIYMTLKMIAVNIFKYKNDSVFIIDRDYNSKDVNKIRVLKQSAIEEINPMDPVIAMCYETGLFFDGVE